MLLIYYKFGLKLSAISALHNRQSLKIDVGSGCFQWMYKLLFPPTIRYWEFQTILWLKYTNETNHAASTSRQSNTCSLQQQQQLFGGLWNGPESKRMWPQRAASSLIPSLPDPSLPAHSCPTALHPLPLLIVLNTHESGGKAPEVQQKSASKCSEFVWNYIPAAVSTYPYQSEIWCSLAF